MQVSVETTSTLERRMTVSVAAARIESEVNKRLQQTARHARVNGFRPGKVPMGIIRQRYGSAARQEVLGDLIGSSLQEALIEQKMQPVSSPSIALEGAEEGKDLQFVATFEVFPELEVKGFEAIKVERLQAEVTEADVDQMLEVLRKQATHFHAAERPAEDGDQLIIDFEGSIDGEAFAGGNGNDFRLVLGSGQMIEGFEAGLLGSSAGDEKTLDLQFPEQYHAKELAGKAVSFKVTVKQVGAPHVPDLDEEFFARFGVKEGGLEAFRDEVRKNMQRELRQSIQAKVKAQVFDGLLANNELEVPKALVAEEGKRLTLQAFQEATGNYELKPDNLPEGMFQDEAKRRVALGLILREAVKQFDLKVDEDRLRARVEEMAAAYQEPAQVVSWYYQNESQLNELRSVVLEEQLVDAVLEKCEVSERAVSYEEAIKRPQANAEASSEEAEQAA